MRLHPAPKQAPENATPQAVSKTAESVKVSVDIYRSSSDRSKFLSVPSGSNLAEMTFPADTDNDLFSVSLYKDNVELERGKNAVGLDVDSILNQIEMRGFAFHGLKFSASLSVGVGLGG